MNKKQPIHGRGTSSAIPNRFEVRHTERDEEWQEEEPLPRTQFLRDNTATIIATNSSPDIPFEASINPYRGCEHGCIYCYARPTHEYLGFSAGLDFESKILVKYDAPDLLRSELNSPKWVPKPLSISGVTDPYQPAERNFRLTRRILEVLLDFRNPAAIVTKNYLATRDIDILAELASYNAAVVFVSITSLNPDLTAVMEPRTARPARRLAALGELAKAGVPVGVMTAPIIPGLNDHEIQPILEAAAEQGAKWAGYVPVRLPLAVAPLFEEWLGQHFPDRKNKILNRIRSMREGKLNIGEFGSRMKGGNGVFADTYRLMFRQACARLGLNKEQLQLSTASFRRFDTNQPSLWD